MPVNRGAPPKAVSPLRSATALHMVGTPIHGGAQSLDQKSPQRRKRGDEFHYFFTADKRKWEGKG
jgi:hypothetical protein